MKKKLFLKRMAAFAVIAAILPGGVASCGKQQEADATDETQNPYIYVSEFYSPDENIETMKVYDDVIYYGTKEGDFYRWFPDSGDEPEKLSLPVPDRENYEEGMLQPASDGSYYLICRMFKEEISEDDVDFTDTYLAKYSPQGEELFLKKISVLVPGCVVQETAVDDEGHLFVLAGGKLLLFDTDGTHKMTVVPETDESINGLARDGSGAVYAMRDRMIPGYLNSVIQELSFQDGLSEEGYENFGGNGFACYAESGFFTTFNGKLYLYDRKEQSQKELLKWMNSNIDANQVESFAALSDGRIVAFLEDELNGVSGEIAVLTKTERSEAPKRQTITVGTFKTDASLLPVVARFNRKSADYRVEVVEYYDPVLDTGVDDSAEEEAYTKLHLDIVSDNCPDILNLEYDELANYASKGLFEDLTPYLDKSGELDILPNVIEAYTFEGELAALPNRIKIHTIVGKSSELQGKNQWSLEEMMAFIDSYPVGEALKADPIDMLECCLALNLSEFVDSEKHTCNFITQDFFDILEFCSRFEGQEGYYASKIYNVWDGGEKIYEVEIDQAIDVTLLMQMFKTNNITFIGFPCGEGGQGNLLEEKNGAYAISSLSENKEAAWSFLEMLLTDPVRLSIATLKSGFPVDRETREQYFALAMEEPCFEDGTRRYSIREGTLKYYVPLQEEVDPILELIDTARAAKEHDGNILGMVLEEAQAYFAGQKTAEETAELIQSRVSIYLEEHR